MIRYRVMLNTLNSGECLGVFETLEQAKNVIVKTILIDILKKMHTFQ